MPRIKIKTLRGAFGEYNPNNDQIVLDKTLKKYNAPSKKLVLYHEMAHKEINDKKIKLPANKEEIVCDLVALFKCKSNELSLLERELKKILIRKVGKNPTIEKLIELDLKKI